jgi:hypothetical protein
MTASHDEQTMIMRLKTELQELNQKVSLLALNSETQTATDELRDLCKSILDKQKLYLAVCKDVVTRDAKPKPKK